MSMPSRLLTYLALALPALWMAAMPAGGASVSDLVHPTGEWSARLIVLALLLGPLRDIFGPGRWIAWLIRRRRAIGVAAFLYAAAHTVFYLVDMRTLAFVLAEIDAPGIWTGWLALLVMVPMAATSNEAAMRLLRRNWKRVQRLAYPLGVLTLVHWWLIDYGSLDTIWTFAPLGVAWVARAVVKFRSLQS